MRLTLSLTVAALVASIILIVPAGAGPPLICHPIEIGDAESLPWGWGPFDRKRGYRVAGLTDDTVAILTESSSALVHLETLRRAALYADRAPETATPLLAALMARALDAEAAGAPDALAWLDAGYLAQCYRQLRMPSGLRCGEASGVVGYGWVQRALALRGNDPELEFAAAMMTAQARSSEHHQHVRRTKKLADGDSLVAANLQRHATIIWPNHRH